MNNTPAWLTVAVAGTTALVAIMTASITTWLTVRSANKRSKAELEHQRERFAQELEHQRELERKKLLFTLRSETYMNFAEAFTEAVDAVSANEVGHNPDNYETVLELAGVLKKLQSLATGCLIIASADVNVKAREFRDHLHKSLNWLGQDPEDSELHREVADFDDVWIPVKTSFRELASAMRHDLGTINDD